MKKEEIRSLVKLAKQQGIEPHPKGKARAATSTKAECPPPPPASPGSAKVTVTIDDELSLKVRWLCREFGRSESDIVTGFLLDNIQQLLDACTEGTNMPEDLITMAKCFAKARNQRIARETEQAA